MGLRRKWAAFQARVDNETRSLPWYEKSEVLETLVSRPLLGKFLPVLVSSFGIALTFGGESIFIDGFSGAEMISFFVNWLKVSLWVAFAVFCGAVLVQRAMSVGLRVVDSEFRGTNQKQAEMAGNDSELAQLRARVEKLEAALVAKDGKAGPSQG